MFAFRAAHCYYPPANTSYSLTMKKKITADQMGTFHMTKPINHLQGAQVQHSRAATHHFTVYQAQTHGHQSMAPRGTQKGGGSHESYWSMPDDFIITHHFIHWRIQNIKLITFHWKWSCCAY